jgi:hypothetical protein
MTTVASHNAGTRRLFTVSEYRRMAEAGLLHEDDRIELLIRAIDDRAIVSIELAEIFRPEA